MEDPENSAIHRELHSLQETSYLKINQSNFITFKYSEKQSDIEISIQQ